MGRAKPATQGRVRFTYTNRISPHSFRHKSRQRKGERHLWQNECLIVWDWRTRPSLAGFNAPRDSVFHVELSLARQSARVSSTVPPLSYSAGKISYLISFTCIGNGKARSERMVVRY
jgi:hypothetical protein